MLDLLVVLDRLKQRRISKFPKRLSGLYACISEQIQSMERTIVADGDQVDVVVVVRKTGDVESRISLSNISVWKFSPNPFA